MRIQVRLIMIGTDLDKFYVKQLLDGTVVSHWRGDFLATVSIKPFFWMTRAGWMKQKVGFPHSPLQGHPWFDWAPFVKKIPPAIRHPLRG